MIHDSGRSQHHFKGVSLFYSHMGISPSQSLSVLSFFPLYVRLQANSQHRSFPLLKHFSCFLLIKICEPHLFPPTIPAWLNTRRYLSLLLLLSAKFQIDHYYPSTTCEFGVCMCVFESRLCAGRHVFNSFNVQTSDKDSS